MNALKQKQFVHHKAFTLIEMVIVIAIVAMLMVFATPALTRTLQATKLASTGEALMGALAEAQQIAYSQGVPVEIRFFTHSEPGMNGGPALVRSYQSFKVQLSSTGTGAGVTVSEVLDPVGNLVPLSSGIVIANDTTLSPLLDGEGLDDIKSGNNSGGGPGYSGVQGAKYTAIRFMPDGSCRTVEAGTTSGSGRLSMLSFELLKDSYLTITYDISQSLTSSNLPKNFYTIQIDPFNGKLRNYYPGF